MRLDRGDNMDLGERVLRDCSTLLTVSLSSVRLLFLQLLTTTATLGLVMWVGWLAHRWFLTGWGLGERERRGDRGLRGERRGEARGEMETLFGDLRVCGDSELGLGEAEDSEEHRVAGAGDLRKLLD